MAKFKPQHQRLQFIHNRIRKGVYPNCRKLAEEWGEVSAKTIQRDLDYLKWQLNAPLEYDASQRGYYYTEENYDIPAINISQSDLFSIFIAEKALKQYRNTPLYEKLAVVFRKIEESLPEKVSVNPNWLEAKFSFIAEPETALRPEIWEIVTRSLDLEQAVRIDYKVPMQTRTTSRVVNPYHITCYRGEWYLIGYCRKKREIRTFAISRIHAAELLEETYEIPDDFDINSLMGSHFGIFWGDEEYTVRIHFASKQAPYVRERIWQPGQEINENKDGSLVLTFQTNALYEVRQWVLSWGSGAKVLSPRELKDDIAAEVRQMTRQYLTKK